MLFVQVLFYKMDKGLLDVIFDEKVEGKDFLIDIGVKDEVFVWVKCIIVFKDKIENVFEVDWDKFFLEEFVENFVFKIWDDSVVEMDCVFILLFLVKFFCFDWFVFIVEWFVILVFGNDLFDIVEDFKQIVDQVFVICFIFFVFSFGFDVFYKVDSLVECMCVCCINIVMGFNEGLVSVDKVISNVVQIGFWVFIKNVYLVFIWFQLFEKWMESLNLNLEFRLFLFMEFLLKIFVNLLRVF